MNRFVLSSLIFTVFTSSVSYAGDTASEKPLSVGIEAAYSAGPYRDYSKTVTPLPLILYEGSVFYIRGTEAGLKILNVKSDEISVSGSLHSIYFKPKDAKVDSLKSLNERKLSGMAGVTWTHTADWGFTLLSAKQRVTGDKKGAVMDAGYGYPFQLGQSLIIVSAGVEYSTAEMNKNYFGISSEESSRSGLRSYQPGGGFSPYLDLIASYPLTNRIDLSAGGRVSRLSNAQYNSPMTKDRLNPSLVASISYNF